MNRTGQSNTADVCIVPTPTPTSSTHSTKMKGPARCTGMMVLVMGVTVQKRWADWIYGMRIGFHDTHSGLDSLSRESVSSLGTLTNNGWAR